MIVMVDEHSDRPHSAETDSYVLMVRRIEATETDIEAVGRGALGKRISSASCCPGSGFMAHIRGCINHPEVDRG